MPYPGIKPGSSTESKMERCVAELMRNTNMRDKYPGTKERKDHAIAICHNSIVGKVTFNSERGGE